jgi:hypothetical protein
MRQERSTAYLRKVFDMMGHAALPVHAHLRERVIWADLEEGGVDHLPRARVPQPLLVQAPVGHM